MEINEFDMLKMKDSKKVAAFDEIAKLFYKKNFGTTSKAEIELLMFSIFMDEMIDTYADPKTNVLNYNACSDYNIGKILGIPQEKVNTLKIKKQARYPKSFDWKKSLEDIQDRIVYDDRKKKVIIPVPDPNLYNEISNFIETNGGYIEIQRGKNVIQMRPEYLFMLLYYGVEDEKEKKKIREHFAKKLREHNETVDIDNIPTDNELSKRALALGDTAFDFLLDFAEEISNPLVGVIKGIKALSNVAKEHLK